MRITQDHWDRTETGFRSLIDHLENNMPKANQDLLDVEQEIIVGEEQLLHMREKLDMRVGSVVVFDQVYEINGDPHKESIRGVVTSITSDSFFYRRIIKQTPGN